MSSRHLDAACYGVLLGCITAGLFAVVLQEEDLRTGIWLMLANGAFTGVVFGLHSLFRKKKNDG